MRNYDVLVIGTGSGNTLIDERFTNQSVAIAEARHFGGTCLNVGCIPTKMFVHTADLARAASDSDRFGIDTAFTAARWPEIRDRIFSRVDAIEAGGRKYRTEDLPNVTVYPEHVRFTGTHSFVTDSGEAFTADRVVVAAGSRPLVPTVSGLDPELVDTPGHPVLTSDTVMRMETLPQSMTILGGGYIAAEFAHIFSSLGVEVRVLTRSGTLLSKADTTVAERFSAAFGELVHVDYGVTLAGIEVDRTVAGAPVVRVQAAASGKVPDARAPEDFDTEVLLLATGRTPNIAGLGLETAGIDVVDGRVRVDPFARVLAGGTPLPGVFALGDISSPHQLKHVANHEARVVGANLHADVLAGVPGSAPEASLARLDHQAVPSAVFSHPQVASVGATESELVAAGVDYVCKVQEYADVAYGWALEDRTGFVKLLADRRTGLILGAHIVGDEASMIIQPLIQAMAFDLPAHRMARGQYWIHPALPEVVENALLGLEF